MPLRIVLLTPKRRFIAKRSGLGYQILLGLVFLGGPLKDAGHDVRLSDNDLCGHKLPRLAWPEKSPRLVEQIRAFRADAVLLGHTGSTAANDSSLAAISQES